MAESEVENSKPNEVEKEEEEEEVEDEEEDEESVGCDDDIEEKDKGRGRRFESELGELHSSEPLSELRLKNSQLETLAVPSPVEVSENGVHVNSTSQLIYETQPEKQNGMSHHREVLKTRAAQVAETQTENKDQLTVYPTPSKEMSPVYVTQSISHAASPTLQEKVKTSGDPQGSLTHKKVSSITVPKTSALDGYNWRKYGQKQVKSPKGSRSYYRCTHSDCFAKKIECCDHMGHVTEIVYKSQHTHEPPRKSNCKKGSKYISSAQHVLENSMEESPSGKRNVSDPSTSQKEHVRETPSLPERKRQNSINSNDHGDVGIKEEHVNEPEPKRRVKKSNLEYSGSVTKAGKKQKIVVHAAGDVGISGDGYRWRKYGQKMVKGNPHPRNYYRCTSAGCPVRKHIETATDNTNAVIITYKGIHDHDMPVPKKRHGPPSAPLVAAAAPASMNNLQLEKTDQLQNQVASTQWSVDNEGELTGEAMELGGEKAMESARTLLSIGFEIKPC